MCKNSTYYFSLHGSLNIYLVKFPSWFYLLYFEMFLILSRRKSWVVNERHFKFDTFIYINYESKHLFTVYRVQEASYCKETILV